MLVRKGVQVSSTNHISWCTNCSGFSMSRKADGYIDRTVDGKYVLSVFDFRCIQQSTKRTRICPRMLRKSRLCYCIPIRLVYVIVSCDKRKDAACTLAIDMDHDHFGRAGAFHSNFIGIFLDLELPLPVKTPSRISSDS